MWKLMCPRDFTVGERKTTGNRRFHGNHRMEMTNQNFHVNDRGGNGKHNIFTETAWMGPRQRHLHGNVEYHFL